MILYSILRQVTSMTPMQVRKKPPESSPFEHAVSQLISSILIVSLAVALGAITLVVYSDLILKPIEKSAYIAVEGNVSKPAEYEVFTLRHLQGDVGYFGNHGEGYPLYIQASSGSLSAKAVPDPAEITWKPGMILYVYRNTTDFVVTDDLSTIAGAQKFDGSEIQVSVVDSTNDILIYSKSQGIGGSVEEEFPRGPGFTIYGWERFTSPPAPTSSDQHWATMVVDGNRDNNRRFHLQHNQLNNRFEFALRTTQMATTNQQARWIQSPSGPQQDVWYCITGTYNQTDGRIRLYINGNEVSSSTLDSSGIAPSPGFYQIGGPQGVTFSSVANQRKLLGDVRGVTTVEEVLLPDEILSIYSKGNP